METLTVRDQVLAFDRYLNKTYLATLSLAEAQLLLTKITTFMNDADTALGGMFTHGLPRPGHDDHSMWLTGYRLCVDLAAQVSERVMDLLTQREQETVVLNSKLRLALQDQYLASQILKTAQGLKHQQVSLGNKVGMGTVI